MSPDPLFRELQVDCYLVVVCCHLGMVPVLYQWSFLFLASSYNLPLAIINKEFFFFSFLLVHVLHNLLPDFSKLYYCILKAHCCVLIMIVYLDDILESFYSCQGI